MVEKFKTILDEIIKEKRQITLFGIFKMDELTEKWSVIFVADWITNENMDEGFAYLSDLMKKHLTNEESDQIARIGVFLAEEHLVQLLLNFKTGARIQDQQVNGNLIHDGFILASNKINEEK